MRLPWTFWCLVLRDFWRLFFVSAGILVGIIAFAASVRFFADGTLGALDTLKFMVLAIPPMLAYALPFAAGFAATLTYHRMASDNELTAAYAGGMPHRAVLAPAIASGLVLSGTLFMLNEQIIPRFLKSMERLITEDMTNLLIAAIERGESVQLQRMIIHADSVTPLPPEESPVLVARGVTDWLLFDRFVAIEIDDTGELINEAIARRAQLILEPPTDADADVAARASLILEDVATQSPDGDLFWTERADLGPFDVPDVFADDPKFLTGGDLARLRHDPDRMNFIDHHRRNVARHLAIEETRSTLHAELEAQGVVAFEAPGDRRLTLRGSGLAGFSSSAGWNVEPTEPGGQIEIELLDRARGTEVRRSAAQARIVPTGFQGSVHPKPGQQPLGLRFRLELSAFSAADADPAAGDRAEVTYDGLRPAVDPLPGLLENTTAEMLEVAYARGGGEPPISVANPVADLERLLGDLGREITSKQHERWAMAASVLVMVCTGAVLALLLADALPLPVYLAGFFPALGTLVFIASGQQMVHDGGAVWLPLLWFGVAGLGIFAGLGFVKVRRH